MKIVIIGGVAAGTKAAAKLKREERGAQVKILTKSNDISYAGCGLPYYIGGLIGTRDELIVNTPAKYSGLTGAEVVTGCEVTSVEPAEKRVTAIKDGETVTESYDRLIIAVGAEPLVPDMPGRNLEGVFCMRTPDDATSLLDYVKSAGCRRAVVAGAGFIGLEVAENLHTLGISVTVIDAAPQIMPNAFDPEMADYAKRRLREAGMRIITGSRILSVKGTEKATGIETDSGSVDADVVVLAIGIRPATRFLEGSGIETERGAVIVDEHMRTNIPDIYAVGDCALVHNMISGKRQWSAMGSTANIAARAMAKYIADGSGEYRGCLGTGVVKLLSDLNAGRTGFTERQAVEAGYDPVSIVCVTDDKAHYYPDSSFFITKLIADNATHKLLGIQVFGAGAVDKMTDIAVTGIAGDFKIEDFDTLDFAYAPRFLPPSTRSFRLATYLRTSCAESLRASLPRNTPQVPQRATKSSMCSRHRPCPAQNG